MRFAMRGWAGGRESRRGWTLRERGWTERRGEVVYLALFTLSTAPMVSPALKCVSISGNST